MNVLYIPTTVPHDFQRETLHWGLRNLHKSGLIKLHISHVVERLYRDYKHELHHFTYYKKWEEEKSTYEAIDYKERIENKFYDVIIIQDALFPSVYNESFFKKIYNIYRDKLIVVDGEDGGGGEYMVELKKYPCVKYFRRELIRNRYYEHNNIFPINFGYPDELVHNITTKKEKNISSIIPSVSNTYIYNETDYYNEYRASKFAYTFSKGGWDCLRHLEIIMNGALPVFLDIEDCPPLTLYFYPKFHFSEILFNFVNIDYTMMNYSHDIYKYGKNEFWNKIIANKIVYVYDTIDMDKYNEIQSEIYEHCNKYLLCSKLVSQMLEKL